MAQKTKGTRERKHVDTTVRIRRSEKITQLSKEVFRWILDISGIERFDFTGRSIVMGRGDDSDLQLPFADVSRQHAKIIFQDNQYRIVDLESTNGTFLNGVKITDAVIQPNDVISLADIDIVIRKECIDEL